MLVPSIGRKNVQRFWTSYKNIHTKHKQTIPKTVIWGFLYISDELGTWTIYFLFNARKHSYRACFSSKNHENYDLGMVCGCIATYSPVVLAQKQKTIIVQKYCCLMSPNSLHFFLPWKELGNFLKLFFMLKVYPLSKVSSINYQRSPLQFL